MCRNRSIESLNVFFGSCRGNRCQDFAGCWVQNIEALTAYRGTELAVIEKIGEAMGQEASDIVLGHVLLL